MSAPSSSADARILCFGEMLIDFVPTVNGVSLAAAPAFLKAPGGAPANVAVGVARLGGASAFMGKVGEDEFGHMLAELLRTNQVDTSGVRFDPGARTALAFVTLREDGEREFMFYRNPSADMLLTPEELDIPLAASSAVVHYGSISLIAEPCRSAHLALLDALQASPSPPLLSYDPNLRLPLWQSADAARDGIRSIWDRADIIKVSDEELTFLTNGGDPSDEAAVRTLFHDRLRLLLVTEGSQGCRFYTPAFSGRVPGFTVATVDTTGAGDAFVAGFLYKLTHDVTCSALDVLSDKGKLQDALLFANACGAITTTVRGAIPALPTKQDALKLLANSAAVA